MKRTMTIRTQSCTSGLWQLASVHINTLTFLTPLLWVVCTHRPKQILSSGFFHILPNVPLRQVNVSFSLSRVPGVVTISGPEFSCDITSSELAPGGSLQATATFSPTVVDTVSVEYLSLKYGGGLSEPQLKLIGNCVGKKSSVSSSQRYKYASLTSLTWQI